MAYNVYSLPDCKSVLYHPDAGTANLQKVPDRTFDRTGTNLTYTLPATTITEQ